MDKQSAIEIFRSFGFAIVLCAVVFVGYRLGIRERDKSLRKWASDNQFELLHFERCFFTGGFSLLTTSRRQTVYFVRVRDHESHERSGWVRVGGFWGGDGMEVKWKLP
jgi:hypothetical protein